MSGCLTCGGGPDSTEHESWCGYGHIVCADEVVRLRAVLAVVGADIDKAFALGRRDRDVDWRDAALGYRSDGVTALVREMREYCPVTKTDDK